MRSFIILGIYGIIAVLFLKWNASIFVIMTSLIVEVIILIFGLFVINLRLKENKYDAGNIVLGSLPMLFIYFLASYFFGDYYNEFYLDPNFNFGILNPYYNYGAPLLVITASLIIGYIIDIRKLKGVQRADKIVSEIVRSMLLLYGIGMAGGLICFILVGTEKWIPLTIMIVTRMFIEIWYLKEQRMNKIS